MAYNKVIVSSEFISKAKEYSGITDGYRLMPYMIEFVSLLSKKGHALLPILDWNNSNLWKDGISNLVKYHTEIPNNGTVFSAAEAGSKKSTLISAVFINPELIPNIDIVANLEDPETAKIKSFLFRGKSGSEFSYNCDIRYEGSNNRQIATVKLILSDLYGKISPISFNPDVKPDFTYGSGEGKLVVPDTNTLFNLILNPLKNFSK